MGWIGHSPKLKPEERIQVLKKMQKFVDDGIVIPSQTDYRISGYSKSKDEMVNKRGTYEELLDVYGSLYNWVVQQNKDHLKGYV